MTNKTIVSIPLTKIMPNPHQPRRSFREGSIQEMADSLTAVGQKTELKVCPLTEAEKAQNAPFEVMVLGGHRRRAGALLAGLEALDCIVLDITPEERGFYALMDNNLDEMDWWDWDVAIYEQFQRPPKLTQTDFAKRIGKSLTKVNNALNVVGSLTPTAKEMIDQNLGKTPSNGSQSGQPKKGEKTLIFDLPSRNAKNKGFMISEYTLLALANLEDPLKVEKAVKVVMDDYLDEPQAKQLVAWEGMGHRLEDYTHQKFAKEAQELNASTSSAQVTSTGSGQATSAQPKRRSRHVAATQVAQTQDPGEKALSETPSIEPVVSLSNHSGQAPSTEPVVSSSNLSRQATSAQPTQTQKPEIVHQPKGLSMVGQGPTTTSLSQTEPIGSAPRNDGNKTPHAGFKLVGHALGQAFHWAGHNSLFLLKALVGYGKQSAVKSLDKSIKHELKRVVRTVVWTAVIFIVLAAVVFFLHGSTTRLIAWFMNVQPPRIQTALEPPSTVQSASGIGNGVPNQTTSQNSITAHSATPKKPETRDEKNAQAALVFARNYFGANYQNIDSWKDFFKQAIDDEDYDPFMEDHFPYDKIHEITDKKLVMSFSPTRPVKLVDSDDSSDTFLVKGVMTTLTHKDGLSEVVSKNSVAAQIVFNHLSSGGYKVGYVKDLTPDEAQALLDSSSDDSTGASKANSSASTKVANSPSELAQPNHGSQQGASTQVANSPSELAQPNQGSQQGASTQVANSPSELAQPNQGSQQGASTQVDPLAKAVGDAASEYTKKTLNLPF